jgi:Zn ribbon nucleic-acid-binding protein
MRLGVIVCPQCKQVKGVDLSSKTTKCVGCGKTLALQKVKIYYETESQEKLRQMIGLLNAELDGKSDAFKKLLDNKHESK